MQLTVEQLEAERPPKFRQGDAVYIKDEDDRVLGRYPYTIGRRMRYGGETCWSWSYTLHGIRGDRVGMAFEDQLVRRDA